MKGIKIQVGGMYVNEQKGFVRLVQAIKEGRVQWRDFGLYDGEPIGSGCCSVWHFESWATRPATAGETGRMLRDKADEEDREHAEGLARLLPSSMIHAEHVARGLLLRYEEEGERSKGLRKVFLATIPDEEFDHEFQRRAAARSGRGQADVEEHTPGATITPRRRNSRRKP